MFAAAVLVDRRTAPLVALAREPRCRVLQGALGPGAAGLRALPRDRDAGRRRGDGGRAVAVRAERTAVVADLQTVEFDLEAVADLAGVVRDVEVAQRAVDDGRLRVRRSRRADGNQRCQACLLVGATTSPGGWVGPHHHCRLWPQCGCQRGVRDLSNQRDPRVVLLRRRRVVRKARGIGTY